MSQRNVAFLIVLVICMIQNSNPATASATWIANSYFQAGNQIVQNRTVRNTTIPTYTFTFANVFPGVPHVVYGLKNLQIFQNNMMQIGFQLGRSNLTATSMTLYFKMQLKSINLLGVTYLAVNPNFPHHFNTFDQVPFNDSSPWFIDLSWSLTSQKATVNYTKQAIGRKHNKFLMPYSSNKIIVYMTGLSVYGNKDSITMINLSTRVLNQSFYQIQVQFGYSSYINKLQFSQIIYNANDIKQSKKYFVQYQEYVMNSTSTFIIVKVPNVMYANQSFLSMVSWKYKQGYCQFDYNYQPGVRIYTSTKPFLYNSSCSYSEAKSILLYIKTWYCPPPTLYINMTTNLCQDYCSSYHYPNVTAKFCDQCHYTCMNCSAGKNATACTQCETNLKRTLVDNSCICNKGFFDDGYSPTCRDCSLVDSKCLKCNYTVDSKQDTDQLKAIFINSSWSTSWTAVVKPKYKCLECAGTFFVNSSGLCQACILNLCLTCLNQSACLTCNSAVLAKKYTNNLCYLCNINNCLMCSSTNVCASCMSGFTLISGACQQCNLTCVCEGWVLPKVVGICSTVCGDGMKVGQQECDDNNTINNDGCSSSCLIQSCNVSCSCNGYTKPIVNGICSTICGDNLIRGTQQCDDGNTINNDGCSSVCQVQSCDLSCNCDGWTLPRVGGSCSTSCGDNVKQGVQECDDGNLDNHDGCSSICKNEACNVSCLCNGWSPPFFDGSCATICGDNIIQGDEQCDDGNTDSNDGCSSTCKNQVCSSSCSCNGWVLPVLSNGSCSTLCGDGYKQGNQKCDDGNLNDHDGCSSSCLVQSCQVSCICDGWVQPFIDGSCDTFCGDGLKRGTQQCDDGNSNNNDGCSSTCMTEPCSISCSCDGWTLPFLNGACSTSCGDNIKQGSQQCDDGNSVARDGCSAQCVIEPCDFTCLCDGWVLPLISAKCSSTCGDGLIRGDEQCDDANTNSNDGCSSTCKVQSCEVSCLCEGWVHPFIGGHCQTACGDGYRQGIQQCDDGNTNNNDGCSSTCKTQQCDKICNCNGWSLPMVNSKCSTTCGDGMVRGAEQCDDGNLNSHDGCSSACKIETCSQSCLCDGWSLPLLGNGSCSTQCGDNFVQGAEECDDGNKNNNDGCSSTCYSQSCSLSCLCDGYIHPLLNGSCRTVCGDILRRGEQQCDDGNTIDRDGCSSTCKTQGCNVTCLCDGYSYPLRNGSCTTLCGDGFKSGMQQCDDNNTLNGDGCDQNCANQPVQTGFSVLIQAQTTQYASLLIFALGFRIVGMEMLHVLQNFQLLLQSQKVQSLQISTNIHGYSNQQFFPIKLPIAKFILNKLNFMYLMILWLLVLSILLKMIQALWLCCRINNKVNNDLTETQNKKIKGRNESVSEQSDDNFTVHYKGMSNNKTQRFQSSKTIVRQKNRKSTVKQSSWGGFVFGQLLFDCVINVLSVFVYSFVVQIKNSPIDEYFNLPSVMMIGSMIAFAVVLVTSCMFQNSLFGENQLKFKKGKWRVYWVLAVAERIISSFIMAYDQFWGIYSLVGIKFMLVIYFSSSQIFQQKIQKWRSVAIQTLHFLLISIFLLNQNYLKKNQMLTNYRQFLVQYIYLAIVAVIFLISVTFYVRQIKNLFSDDSRNNKQPKFVIAQSQRIGSAVFDAKDGQVLQDSSHPIHLTSSTILDEIRSKKFVRTPSKVQTPQQVISQMSNNKIQIKKTVSRNYLNYANESGYGQQSAKSRKGHQTNKKVQSSNKSDGLNLNYDWRKRETYQTQNNQNIPPNYDMNQTQKMSKSKAFLKSTRRMANKTTANQTLQDNRRSYQDQDRQKQHSNRKNKDKSKISTEHALSSLKKQSRVKFYDKKSRMNVLNSNRDHRYEDQQYDDNYDVVSIQME